MTEHTQTPWMWAWRYDETAPASIFSMVREGHAYAVAMCPRYQKPEQWVADAKFVLKAVNSHDALVEALLRAREAVNAIVLSTHSISFDADLRAIDMALEGCGHAVGSAPKP